MQTVYRKNLETLCSLQNGQYIDSDSNYQLKTVDTITQVFNFEKMVETVEKSFNHYFLNMGLSKDNNLIFEYPDETQDFVIPNLNKAYNNLIQMKNLWECLDTNAMVISGPLRNTRVPILDQLCISVGLLFDKNQHLSQYFEGHPRNVSVMTVDECHNQLTNIEQNLHQLINEKGENNPTKDEKQKAHKLLEYITFLKEQFGQCVSTMSDGYYNMIMKVIAFFRKLKDRFRYNTENDADFPPNTTTPLVMEPEITYTGKPHADNQIDNGTQTTSDTHEVKHHKTT